MTDEARDDARAYQAAERALGELGTAASTGRSSRPRMCSPASSGPASARRLPVRPAVSPSWTTRARTRTFDVVFLLGLEEGSFLAARPTPLDDEARRARTGWKVRARRARPVPLHGVYEGAESARARPGGGERRRRAARAEPVLGGRARALRSGRDGTRDAPATALQPDLGDRVRAERAGASPGARPARRGRSRRRRGARSRQRLVATPRKRAEAAFDRATRLRSPSVLDSFSARTVFSATGARSASPTASSAWSNASSPRGRSTPSSTRCCEGRSCTRP